MKSRPYSVSRVCHSEVVLRAPLKGSFQGFGQFWILCFGDPKPYLDPKEPTSLMDLNKEIIISNPKKGRLFGVQVHPKQSMCGLCARTSTTKESEVLGLGCGVFALDL